MQVRVRPLPNQRTDPESAQRKLALERDFFLALIFRMCVTVKPRMGIEKLEKGTEEKVDWCNTYLKEFFGDSVSPVVLN